MKYVLNSLVFSLPFAAPSNFNIAQNHATYLETLSALRAPNQTKKRPKLFRVAHVLHFFALTKYKLLVSTYGFCRRDVNKKYKTAGDSVDLVEVLAFSL